MYTQHASLRAYTPLCTPSMPPYVHTSGCTVPRCVHASLPTNSVIPGCVASLPTYQQWYTRGVASLPTNSGIPRGEKEASLASQDHERRRERDLSSLPGPWEKGVKEASLASQDHENSVKRGLSSLPGPWETSKRSLSSLPGPWETSKRNLSCLPGTSETSKRSPL